MKLSHGWMTLLQSRITSTTRATGVIKMGIGISLTSTQFGQQPLKAMCSQGLTMGRQQGIVITTLSGSSRVVTGFWFAWLKNKSMHSPPWEIRPGMPSPRRGSLCRLKQKAEEDESLHRLEQEGGGGSFFKLRSLCRLHQNHGSNKEGQHGETRGGETVKPLYTKLLT